MALDQNTSGVQGNAFNKGLNKSVNESSIPEGSYVHARNATEFSVTGDLNTRGNEPSNLLCANIPYTVIGTVHLYGDKWAVFSTDDFNSEIGLFDDSECKYTPIVKDPCLDNSPCLNFRRTSLIKGGARQNFDCTWQVYWADGYNPDRTMNMDNVPYVQDCVYSTGQQVIVVPPPVIPVRPRDTYYNDTLPVLCPVDAPCYFPDPLIQDTPFQSYGTCRACPEEGPQEPTVVVIPPTGCITCTDTCQIDCDKLRLAPLVTSPCLELDKGTSGGNLLNGSYFVVAAYVINEQRVTDYYPPSNVQALFEHDNAAGSLIVTVGALDTVHFSDFELVLVRTVNQQTTAKRIGIYSTGSRKIFIDNINESLIDIPIEQVPFRAPVYEKSEAMYEVGNYLLRLAPTTKFDFNYQPLANRIRTQWVATEYPEDYYRKGGNVTSYLRDEVYPFFIRWVYTTGDRSSSYHIPGRAATTFDIPGGLQDQPEKERQATNTIDTDFDNTGLAPELWQAYNTAEGAPISPKIIQEDGGVIIGKGRMGYWESTEIYPDKQPEIWNTSTYPWSNLPGEIPVDLCGLPIRHHKMPDNFSAPGITEHFMQDPATKVIKIRVIGVEFDRIRPPVDNQGFLIPGIIGYEILRGSREGNKTVIAKGIINNMRSYNLTNTPGKFGLYPNYPYNPLGEDITLCDPEARGGFQVVPETTLKNYSQQLFTFHSPDTQFKNPFLSMKELKIYGEYTGNVQGNFSEVPGHPREKLLGNISFFLAVIVGVATASKAIAGKRTTKYIPPQINSTGFFGTAGTDILTGGTPAQAAILILNGALFGIDNAPLTSVASLANLFSAMELGNALSINESLKVPFKTTATGVLSTFPAAPLPVFITDREWSDIDFMPAGLRLAGGVQTFSHYLAQGADATLRLIESICPYFQYAYRYVSHGFYNNFYAPITANRRLVLNSNYLDNQFQDFGTSFKINNLYRGRSVVLQTKTVIPNPTHLDDTIQSIGSALANGKLPGGDVKPESWRPENVKLNFGTTTSCHYTALKLQLRAQYGQLQSIQQLPISCVFNLDTTKDQLITDYTTFPIYGGDTYITRYTEKNTFFYFYDWLMNQPDGTEFNYKLRYMLNYPRYWADFTRYDTAEFMENFMAAINPLSDDFGHFSGIFPAGKASLDRANGNGLYSFTALVANAIQFRIKNAYFYLFQSGVRDFYVESEINTDLRDWGNSDSERHYDTNTFTDLNTLFAPPIIKSGNYFKYDFSLSISRLFINFISWGNLQPRSYSPEAAEKCFSYYPNRVIYSLPQHLENKKDYWRVYLANNYKDFKSRITTIKNINKSGALLLFDSMSPIMFQGLDELQTTLGTKLTIGDGGLFSQPMQNVTNADDSYEYGSCQNRLSVLNTPTGIYWMSTNQGKVFQMGQGLKDITLSGLKFWFKKYLPYFLTQDFPDYDLTDNPVVGIGCQAVYDNQIETIYFCKKDYKLKPQYKFNILTGKGISYVLPIINPVDHKITPGYFMLDNINSQKILLTNTEYFIDASWTVSYNPSGNDGHGSWISYHDWHPELLIPSKNNFLSIITDPATGRGGIWRHNFRTDSYCNYYGIDYPFELEYVAATGIKVNTVRNLEYYLECYKYDTSGINKYQLLTHNFDQAIITNNEQTSGVLKLIYRDKNNPAMALLYPQIHASYIDILFTKEEQKYRFNTFWDITADRGEFTNAQRVIWLNDVNGYTRTLNPDNLNYQKNVFQRKKFRGYLNKVSLSRAVSGNVKMIMKVILTKLLDSKR